MSSARSLRSSVRSVLALGSPARRRAVGVLRLAVLTALLWGLASGPAAAQPPYRQELLRGFSSFDVAPEIKPDLVDFDGDGDLDVVIGERYGSLLFFENTGTSTAPAFTVRTGGSNPLSGVSVAGFSAPEVADLDGDGDLDVVIGSHSLLAYFENTGSSATPVFVQRAGTASPFNGTMPGFDATPELADVDGDGDLDAVAGERYGSLQYFANTGSASAPAFLDQTGTANPFSGIDVGNNSAPALTDLDGDGDLDAAVGSTAGDLRYFENSGSSSAPAFVERAGTAGPFPGLDVGTASCPDFGDLDGDGDRDVVSGERDGTLRVFTNTGASSAPAFVTQTGSANPLSGVDFGGESRPDLGDLDGDGDLDAVVGSTAGDLTYLANTATSSVPAFVELSGTASPCSGIDVGAWSAPALADLDGDGDLDLVVGESEGGLKYFANTGSSSAPAFVERTDIANPFFGIDVGSRSCPALVDLDGDGDRDALVGESGGTLRCFVNAGSPSAPLFSEATGTANPFAGIDLGSNSAPGFADLDDDGDLDGVLGEYSGNFNYFANTGSSSAPAFLELTGTASPFAGIDLGFNSKPVLADLDGDWDFDLLSGDRGGHLVFYRSGWLIADDFERGVVRAWWAPGS